MAEVDGNRTRRTGIARPTRFEGGGSHQVCGHLRPARYRSVRRVPDGPLDTPCVPRSMLPAMKKIIVIVVLLALAAFAVKKLQDA